MTIDTTPPLPGLSCGYLTIYFSLVKTTGGPIRKGMWSFAVEPYTISNLLFKTRLTANSNLTFMYITPTPQYKKTRW